MTHTKYSLNSKKFSAEVLSNTPYSAYTEEMLQSLPYEELVKVLPSASLCDDGGVSFTNLDEMYRFNNSDHQMALQRVRDMAAKRREQMKKKKK